MFSCDCLAVPFKNESADAVISIAVIHHLANEVKIAKIKIRLHISSCEIRKFTNLSAVSDANNGGKFK